MIETIEDEQFKGMLHKHFKEVKYHLRHSREWVLRLGDGTEESQRRIQDAFDEIWMYTGELFDLDETDQEAIENNHFVDVTSFKEKWLELVEEVLEEATLELPDNNQYMFSGSRQGRHTEYLGRLLSEMQFLRRSYPDSEWK
jgi:ring-1,2-phenylacetyl-CoA epoxidase subunit PaaC